MNRKSWITKRRTCRLCSKELELDHISYADVPVAGVYVNDLETSRQVPRGSLSLCSCPACHHLQMRESLATEFYDNYQFVGASSTAYSSYLQELAGNLSAIFGKGAKVIEIGCGDATLLGYLQASGLNVLGVDASLQLVETAKRRNIPALHAFFDRQTELPEEFDRPQLVIFRHVLEHVDDTTDFLEAVANIATNETHILCEVPDAIPMLEKKLYGNIYHSHQNYFYLKTLTAMFANIGFQPTIARRVPIFGGSLLVLFSKENTQSLFKDGKLTGEAIEARAIDAPLLEAFCSDWKDYVSRLKESLYDTNESKTSYGYGASERVASILGIAGINQGHLQGLLDNNANIHGMYLAGTELLITSPQELKATASTKVFIFAQSHEKEIVSQLKQRHGNAMQLFSTLTMPPNKIES